MRHRESADDYRSGIYAPGRVIRFRLDYSAGLLRSGVAQCTVAGAYVACHQAGYGSGPQPPDRQDVASPVSTLG
jgi:hypothetical protein